MRPLLALCALALLLPGCGGSDPVEAAGGTVHLRIDEYRILPREIHVTGPRLRIVMTDAGILTHNVKVFSTTEFDADGKPIQIGDGTPTAPGRNGHLEGHHARAGPLPAGVLDRQPRRPRRA